MPELQAEPGDWVDLCGKVLTLSLDPTGETDAFEENPAGMVGPFLFWLYQISPDHLAKINGETLEIIGRSNPDKIDIGQSAAKLAYGLVTAGHILSYVLRLDRHNPSLASVAKAVRILEWRYTQERSSASPASIKAAWSKYKYLAPFVVGFFNETDRAEPIVSGMPQFLDVEAGLECDLNIKPDGIKAYLLGLQQDHPGFDRYFTEVMPYVIAVAEKFRVAGEKYYAPGQKVRHRPLLDPNKTWGIPEGFELPEVELVLDELSPEELKAATVK
jgi:hypothetical protein